MFLYNGEQSYSYADLLKAVCMDDYVPLLKTHDLFKYFSNLIKALVNNKPLVLLDSDLSLSELGGINEEKINVIEKLRTQKFSSMDEVVKALQQSASEITIFTSGTTGQPKKVIHSVQGLTRSVRCAERYQWQVWAYAYNPTHMAGLQVFFQAFENQNTLVNVFGLARNEVYSLIEKYSVTHISATPTFYRLLLPFEKEYSSVQRITFGGEKSDRHLFDVIHDIFPLAKINNIYASTEAGSLFAAKGDCFQIPVSIRDKFMVVDDELLIHAHTGYKGLAMYASSKGALEAFSKDTAREWGELGIRSNVVVPGFMETAMSATLTEEQKNRIYKRTSMKAATSVRSVAETVAFLLSDGACSITGVEVRVDNGTI